MNGVVRLLPNGLSALRIGLSLALFFIAPFSPAFWVLYAVCGVSDVLDGFLARALGLVSRLGARLDSAGDLVFFSFLAFFVCVHFSPEVLRLWPVLSAVAAVRLASFAVLAVRAGKVSSVHTLANKATGIALFFFPALSSIVPVFPLAVAVSVLAVLSAVEELLIALTSKKFDLDRKSFFAGE